MKNLGILFLLLACIGNASCNRTQKQKVKEEKALSSNCYKAIYENDTVNLKINTLKNGKITGYMVMKVSNMPDKIGKIAGEYRGDTLFAAYTFIQGTNNQVTYKNPLAFLKREKELVLGNGKIETTMGASYFVKGSPIDFDNVKYKFTAVECSNK